MDKLAQKVKKLYLSGKNRSEIAKELNVSVHKVRNIYDDYKISELDRSKRTKKNTTCKMCKVTKPLVLFRQRLKKNRVYYESCCIECEQEKNKTRLKKRYEEKGRQEFLEKYKNPELKKKHLKQSKDWDSNNRERRNRYRATPAQRKRAYEWRNNKVNQDCSFKLRLRISSHINYYLIKNYGSKNGSSCLKHLPYTIAELKTHLESRFDDWMNWDNWGKYDPKTWDDNDKSTWTWQIDHIIPASEFKYKTMNDPAFLQCWSLSNLRPLSAKENIIDGAKGNRHK